MKSTQSLIFFLILFMGCHAHSISCKDVFISNPILLGEGGFSSVFKVKDGNSFVAHKVYHRRGTEDYPETMSMLQIVRQEAYQLRLANDFFGLIEAPVRSLQVVDIRGENIFGMKVTEDSSGSMLSKAKTTAPTMVLEYVHGITVADYYNILIGRKTNPNVSIADAQRVVDRYNVIVENFHNSIRSITVMKVLDNSLDREAGVREGPELLGLNLTLRDSSTMTGEAYISLSSGNVLVSTNGELVFIDPI